MATSLPKYPRHGMLRQQLNCRVDAYFGDSGLSSAGGAGFLCKSLLILAWLVLSYLGMVLWADAWWSVAALAVSFGMAVAGVGFSIMHDGGHGAASGSAWVTRLAAKSLDLIGGSSHLWAFKHNYLHHQYPNVDGVDHDIVAEPWLRLTEFQRHRSFHRAQFIYFPLAYAFLAAKWLLIDDFRTLLTRRVGSIPHPPVSRTRVLRILAGKVVAFSWAFAIPIAVHGIAWTLLVFAVWAAVAGLVLATVFQLAHSVSTTEPTDRVDNGQRMPRSWAEQQLASTMNFAPGNRLLTWYLGGLNYQIEHHLFPRISHVHYPAIAPLVRQVCAEMGVPYRSTESLRGALATHTRFLRELGVPPTRSGSLPSAGGGEALGD